ncbi:MAG: hypothetical protein M4579_002474 [Chaenotheca gracillima]|nr:MAG: hypothetical protein M4579_002474 [Chaenotheca gracillima]
MYGDSNYGRRESRPLSFLPQQRDEALITGPGINSDSSRATQQSRAPISRSISDDRYTPTMNGQGPSTRGRGGGEGNESGSLSRTRSLRDGSPVEPGNAPFPLSDVDYESNPAAVAKEMSNLQALRRMSLVDNAAADPDLPGYKSPLVAPTGADSEEDASRLFWVPARIHPELAPKEFKTFLENRVDQIKRRSGEESLSPESLSRQNSDSSLRRKRSMLSRQIDNSSGMGGEGYTDGAERLERKRSLSGNQRPELRVADLQDDDSPKDSPSMMRKLSIDTGGESHEKPLPELQELEDDAPILPAVPPGNSLRRSTRTTYRRGSLRKGERVPGSKRAARAAETDTEDSPVSPPALDFKISRVQTEPIRSADEQAENFSRPIRSIRGRSPQEGQQSTSSAEGYSLPSISSQPAARASAPPGGIQRAMDSRPEAQLGRSSTISEMDRNPPVPRIVETPPPPDNDDSPSGSPYSMHAHIPERKSSHEPPPSLPPQGPLPHGPSSSSRGMGRGGLVRQAHNARNTGQTLDDIVGQPSPLPGNSTRTDHLSFIPTFNDEKKSDKKSRDKKDRESGDAGGTRKASWGWFGFNDEKDKDKDANKKSKNKNPKPVDKSHDNTRLDLLQSSIDGSGRGRESIVLDRDSIRLDEERKKESSRKSGGGDTKKEKDSGLFSFFSNVKKKGDRDSASRKDRSSRTLSPDPPHHMALPDVDYDWARFPIGKERGIYRMAHIKLANPRRALCSQVLLSNFMYAYLAKIQQVHPQASIAQGPSQKHQRQQQPHQTQSEQDHQQQHQQQQHQGQDGSYYQYHDQGGGNHYVEDSQMYDYEGSDQSDHNQNSLHRPQSRASSHSNPHGGSENGHAYAGGNQYYHHQGSSNNSQQHHNQYDLQSQFDEPDGARDDEMW